MSQDQIVEKVNKLMTESFEIPVSKLTPEATLFQDLELDSLDAVDLIVRLEEELKVKVDAERMATIKSMQDVYGLVTELANESQVFAKAKSN